MNREGAGRTPMALLGTADFDGSEVNPECIRIDGVAPAKWNMESVARPYMPFVDKPLDAYECNEIRPESIMDLTLKFKT